MRPINSSSQSYEENANARGFFELNLKWIQIMFFAATRRRSTYACYFLSLSFAFDRTVCCVMRGERKLKFQIVYNYFSINCHTLHSPTVYFLLSWLLNYWRFFFSFCRYLFLAVVVLFRVRKLIIYRSLICFIRCFFTCYKTHFFHFDFSRFLYADNCNVSKNETKNKLKKF